MSPREVREQPQKGENRDRPENGAHARRHSPSALSVEPPAEQNLREKQKERENGKRPPDLDAKTAADDSRHEVVETAREAEVYRNRKSVGFFLRQRGKVSLPCAPARVAECVD